MNSMRNPPGRFCVALLAIFSFGLAAGMAEPAAFDLIQEGNRHVGEQSKDKVVQIRSEKSLVKTDLHPDHAG